MKNAGEMQMTWVDMGKSSYEVCMLSFQSFLKSIKLLTFVLSNFNNGKILTGLVERTLAVVGITWAFQWIVTTLVAIARVQVSITVL